MILRSRNLNLDGCDMDGIKGHKIMEQQNQTASIVIKTVEEYVGIEKMDVVEVDPLIEEDFDKETERDLTAVATYVKDIFEYYKFRERSFKISNYFSIQPFFDWEYRATLVNWLVDVQETLEFNHEVLYLAVKLFDLYLSRTPNIPRDRFELIFIASAFIACKYEERSPPLIDDFIYLATKPFNADDLMRMERELFATIGFDLGAPISYRFLRRYARITKTEMPMLTLARYILETSLMFFEFNCVSESLMAAACFMLAVRMKKIGDWTPVLEKNSGYTKEQVEPLAMALNHMIIGRNSSYLNRLDNIVKKYSHEVFFEVAHTNSLPDKIDLLEPIMPPLDLMI